MPSSALGVDTKTNLTRFVIQESSGNQTPGTYFVDDVTIEAAPAPAHVAVQVNALQNGRVVDDRFFGVNTAIYDSVFSDPTTIKLLAAMDNRTFRFPGGSLSNNYHWETNTTEATPYTGPWATNFDTFSATVRSVTANTQVFITVNYGSGSPEEAARWVKYSNQVRRNGFRYWEIGNECYGEWKNDMTAAPQSPTLYASALRIISLL